MPISEDGSILQVLGITAIERITMGQEKVVGRGAR